MSSDFIKNTGKLLAGNGIGQIIGIIAIPIITRLYSVEVYGAFAAILAISMVLSTISTLSLHLAILIPKSDIEADKILRLSFAIMVTFCIALTIVILAFSNKILTLLGISSAGWIIYTIPVLVFLQSCYLIFTYWGVRQKSFGTVSRSKIAEGLSDRVIAIIAGVAGYVSIHSLIFARLISNIISILYLRNLFQKKIRKDKNTSQEVISYKNLIVKYKRYLQYNTPSMLLMNSMLQLPVIIFSTSFSPAAAGLYAIANRVVNIPVSALGSAISKTYTQKVADEYANNNTQAVERDTERFFYSLFSLLLIPFSLLSIVGEELFRVLLGTQWSEAGLMASTLSFLAISTLLAQAFGGLFDVLGKQKVRLGFHVVNFILRVGVILLMVNMGKGPIETVAAYAAIATLMNLCALQLLFSFVGKCRLLVDTFRKNIVVFFIFYGGTYWLHSIIENNVFSFLIVCFTAFLWLCSVVYMNVEMKTKVRDLYLQRNNRVV